MPPSSSASHPLHQGKPPPLTCKGSVDQQGSTYAKCFPLVLFTAPFICERPSEKHTVASGNAAGALLGIADVGVPIGKACSPELSASPLAEWEQLAEVLLQCTGACARLIRVTQVEPSVVVEISDYHRSWHTTWIHHTVPGSDDLS